METINFWHYFNLSIFNLLNRSEKKLKKGLQEYEANQFATEYLMPTDLFYEAAKGKKFSPDLVRSLAERFKTSLTSVAFKYFDSGLYPLAMFHIFAGKIRYWKKSPDLKVWIKEFTKLPPPQDSVAIEYIDANYKPIYKRDELQQEISKSTYFKLGDYDEDSDFYEYCIVTESYKNILSIVWED